MYACCWSINHGMTNKIPNELIRLIYFVTEWKNELITHLVVVFTVDSSHLPAEYEVPICTPITLPIN